jgi:N-acetylglucosaminyldiphosphoundecaprenol N-acetyl-beta-D-mannosaminyltransferase
MPGFFAPDDLSHAGRVEKGSVASIRLLGLRVDRLRLPEMLNLVLDHVRQSARATVLYVNVHCMNVAAQDATYRRMLDEADLVYCDGTGVRLGAWLSGQHLPQRMTGADWIDSLCRLAGREGMALYFLGGAPGAASDAARVLQDRYEGLKIAGVRSGYDIAPDVIDEINRSNADFVLVGMGTPRQEKWIAAHRDQLNAPVVWAVGALFDFVSGRIPRGPRWMTNHGLEWLCRLAAEPRKLWRRYLIGNPQFLWRVIRHYWMPRRFSRKEHRSSMALPGEENE